MTTTLEEGEWPASRPSRTLTWERPGTHFTEGLVGLRAGTDGRKNLASPEFDPRNAQPAVSRCTD